MNLAIGTTGGHATRIELVPSTAAGGAAFPRKAQLEAAAGATIGLTARMIAQAATECDVRFERIAELRARIEAGTYRVASAEIAESLIGVMRA